MDYNTELAVSYEGDSYDSFSNEYLGVVVIPEDVTYNGHTYGVTSIGEDGFSYCAGLIFVTIPNSVMSIGAGAFSACIGLEKIYCHSKTPIEINANVFGNDGEYGSNYIYNTATLYIPSGGSSLVLYQTAMGWSQFAIIEGFDPTSVSSIETDGVKMTDRYSIDGHCLSKSQRGVNIIRMSDGTIRKVVVK